MVGRITFDSETSEGSVKLNEASLTLESSRQMGSGARVPLRFDPHVKLRQGRQGVGGIGLFPGAIAALRGKNGGGGSYLVSEILSVRPYTRLFSLHEVSMLRCDAASSFASSPNDQARRHGTVQRLHSVRAVHLECGHEVRTMAQTNC